MTSPTIPLVDLAAQHREIAQDVAAGLAELFKSAAFILGPAVKTFETAYAAFLGVDHCVGVANGTDAVELALRAVGVGPGDEVILPVNTFIATALGVVRAGATPVLVDCDPRYLLIDPEQVAARITPRTRAVMPVHLFGQMAPMDSLETIAATRLLIVEDAAQAQGARQQTARAGAAGVAAATSFYPGKNLGAYGDAGAVTTRSAEIAARLRALRNYGSDRRYHHPEIGFNSRLDTLQAIVLSAKLAHLARWNEARRQAASRYDRLLADVPQVRIPETLPGNEHIFHLYVIRLPKRDAVLAHLNAHGVGAAIHYPVPIHQQGAFRALGHRPGDFPVAEKAAGEILSLPMFPQITPDQQARVIDVLRQALR